MALAPVIANTISTTLTNSGLTLASGSSTTSIATLGVNGALFQDFPTLTAIGTMKTYFGNTGSVDQSKKFWLYVQNYDTAVDAYVLTGDAAPGPFSTVTAVIGWRTGINYVAHEVCEDAGIYYRCILAHLSAATRPAADATNWIPLTIPTLNAVGAAWIASTSYVANQVVVDGSTWYKCRVAVSGTVRPALDMALAVGTGDTSAGHWIPHGAALVVPFSKAILTCMVGSFHVCPAGTPTALNNFCKVLCIQDNA